eukprot:CAMPEP_0180024082 /NCGR_PEP_ID=MMETSP0984-20121128/23896_1 /TAXON_ID=483367 /ORGANISM="non described non described, Strain CCMP 2436" /LENGTH=162 /DNA_ID=CAMNT_0021948551 /DNA_START=282 /DNA_END=770 /DNA_ORIENTATION=-
MLLRWQLQRVQLLREAAHSSEAARREYVVRLQEGRDVAQIQRRDTCHAAFNVAAAAGAFQAFKAATHARHTACTSAHCNCCTRATARNCPCTKADHDARRKRICNDVSSRRATPLCVEPAALRAKLRVHEGPFLFVVLPGGPHCVNKQAANHAWILIRYDQL